MSAKNPTPRPDSTSAARTRPAGRTSATDPVLAGLERLPQGVAVFDSRSRLVVWNARFMALGEYPAAMRRRGTPLARFLAFHAERHPVVSPDGPAEALPLTAWRGAPEARAAELAAGDGRWLELRHDPLQEGGSMLQLADVTDRVRSREALHQAEDWFALIEANFSEGIYVWKIKENELYLTPRFQRDVLGFALANLGPQDWNDRIHPDDYERYRDFLREHFRGRTERMECEYRVRNPAGEYRWVLDRGVAARNEQGRAVRLVGVVADLTERRRAEDALRQSEERYALAMQAVNEGLYDWNIAEDTIYYSPRVRAYMGLTEQELSTPEDWTSRIHPDDLPLYQDAMRDHLKGRSERFQCEYRYRASDGNWRWARQHGLAIRDAAGRAYRMIGSTGDITEQRELANELERARSQLFDAIEAISEGFALFDNEDRLVLFNENLRQVYGDAAGLLAPGVTFPHLLRSLVERGTFPAVTDDPAQWMAERVRSHRNPGAPIELQNSDGRWVRISERKTHDGGIVGTYADITEIKQRQLELAEALELQAAIVEVIDVINRSATDLQPVFETLLRNAARLCGADRAIFYRLNGDVLNIQSSYHVSPELVARRMAHPPRVDGEYVSSRSVRERRPVQVVDVLADAGYEDRVGQPIEGQRTVLCVPVLREGEPIASITIFRVHVDPFTDKQVQILTTFAEQAAIAITNANLFEALQARTVELEIASQHKSQFLANMSHELRTPLNAILGYTELIRDGIYGEVPAKVSEVMERVQLSGRHLLGLINNVLDLSKIEAGEVTLSVAPYSLSDALHNVYVAVEPLAAEKGLALELDVPDDLPLGHGDEQRLTQVLLNLAGNAVKFCDAGAVTLRARAEDEVLRISVSDTGPGIAPEDQTRIFEQFRQAENAATKAKGGSGLGLAIARTFIEMHGGRIWADSTLGQGTTFWIELPVRGAPPEEDA